MCLVKRGDQPAPNSGRGSDGLWLGPVIEIEYLVEFCDPSVKLLERPAGISCFPVFSS